MVPVVKKYWLLSLCLGVSLSLAAEEKSLDLMSDSACSLSGKASLYGGLVHQHQNFYGRAFSYQGVETGVYLRHHYLMGIYASTFVSNLRAERVPLFVNMRQAGLLLGAGTDDRKFLHAGCLMNLGLFGLKADPGNFPVFRPSHPSLELSGWVLAPQLYAELNVSGWMKLRTGLAYSFYGYADRPIAQKSDLQGLSMSFGFIFGKFR
jgi:hypothetical protein